MALGMGEEYRRKAKWLELEAEEAIRSRAREEQKIREEDLVTVKCRCKSCGKEFSVRIYPKWKSDVDTEEKREIELDVKCPECQSSEFEVLDR
jgi:Zn finger protein HypA/HybF involved in hydrogenase expression